MRKATDPIRAIQEDVHRMRKKGVDLIDLSMGAPDKPAPEAFRNALRATLDYEPGSGTTNPSGYTLAQGFPPLVEKVAELEQRVNGWERSGDTLITNGASGAIMGFLMSFEPGEVVTAAPYFPLFKRFAEGAGHTLAVAPYREDDGEQLHLLETLLSEETRAIIYNEPNNPSGIMRSREFLARLGRLAERHGASILSDEAYRGIYLDEDPGMSVLEAVGTPWCASAYSVSKTAGLAGERIGWLTLHPDYPDRGTMDRIRQVLPSTGHIQAQTRAQVALAACDMPLMADWSENVATLETVLEGLTGMGYHVIEPGGGLYLAVQSPTDDGQWLAERLLHSGTPVATVPCAGFGLPPYVRVSFVGGDTGRAEEALETFRAVR